MMTIIDGKNFSQKVLNEIKKEHNEIKEKKGRAAGLAVIIVGENPASQVYVRNKINIYVIPKPPSPLSSWPHSSLSH